MLDILNQIDSKYSKITQSLIYKRSLSENICGEENYSLKKVKLQIKEFDFRLNWFKLFLLIVYFLVSS